MESRRFREEDVKLARHWLEVVSVVQGEREKVVSTDILLGCMKKGHPKHITVHREKFNGRTPRWMEVLECLRLGDWIFADSETNRIWNRIKKVLHDVNERNGTNFELKSRLLEKGNNRASIGLVGG